jgi:hypothetical protein
VRGSALGGQALLSMEPLSPSNVEPRAPRIVSNAWFWAADGRRRTDEIVSPQLPVGGFFSLLLPWMGVPSWHGRFALFSPAKRPFQLDVASAGVFRSVSTIRVRLSKSAARGFFLFCSTGRFPMAPFVLRELEEALNSPEGEALLLKIGRKIISNEAPTVVSLVHAADAAVAQHPEVKKAVETAVKAAAPTVAPTTPAAVAATTATTSVAAAGATAQTAATSPAVQASAVTAAKTAVANAPAPVSAA